MGGARGLGGCLRGFFGGGAKYFCWGPKFPPSLVAPPESLETTGFRGARLTRHA